MKCDGIIDGDKCKYHPEWVRLHNVEKICEICGGNKNSTGNTQLNEEDNILCKHRGAKLYEKDCKCANGRIWECSKLGKVLERMCNERACKGYEPKKD
jgi:hypothetical protein